MIIDNVILVGIVLSLILGFGMSYFDATKKDRDNSEILLLSVIGTLGINIIFWGVGYFIFWILKLIFN